MPNEPGVPGAEFVGGLRRAAFCATAGGRATRAAAAPIAAPATAPAPAASPGETAGAEPGSREMAMFRSLMVLMTVTLWMF